MRRVDLDSSAYFRRQGSGAAILKGFATIIRVTARISHQRWRSPCDKRGKSKDCQNADTSRNCHIKPGGSSGRHSWVFRMAPAYVVALPVHFRLVVLSFSFDMT